MPEFKLRKLATKLIYQLRTLWQAVNLDREEDQLKVVYGVIRRLPLRESTRHRLLQKAVSWVLTKHQKSPEVRIQEAQAVWDANGKLRLEQLLAGNENFDVPHLEYPLVSFIVIVKDKAHLTVLTLESVLKFAEVPYELIVVDNGSTDDTTAMLERFKAVRVIRNQNNLGFGPACMQGAEAAKGEHLCFLNNDALLTPGAVTAALKNFDTNGVGAVGGKILLANGLLQEAGSIIWSDGSALGYGRSANPRLPQYNFRRRVDYCSAVFLITPRDLFLRLGGFDADFAPAYYEDTDYCMTLWQNGWQVVYEPLTMISHYESASSGTNELAQTKMVAHQAKFKKKWSRVLQNHFPPELKNVPAARFATSSAALRIVYVDDRIPKRTLGSGYPRSNDVVTALARMGHQLTCSTSLFPLLDDNREDLPLEVELFDGYQFPKRLVDEYLTCADVVWISRPHNLKLLRREFPGLLSSRQFSLVYDSEAIVAPRAHARQELLPASNEQPHPLEPVDLDEEIALAKLADTVVVVSEADRVLMRESGVKSVHVVSHALTSDPTPAPFEQRDGFLFIGAMHDDNNPNADSIREFYQKQWARIHRETGAAFVVAGYGTERLRTEMTADSFQILGPQPDLRPLYNRARVFVVPTRYAAGIPFKAHEAAANGVPMVVSPLIAKQILWTHEFDYLAADDLDQMAELCIRLYRDQLLWETVRAGALARVATELDSMAFAESLRQILDEVTTSRSQAVNPSP